MVFIVCTLPPPFPLWEGGEEGVSLQPNFKKRGVELDKISIFRGGCWERGVAVS